AVVGRLREVDGLHGAVAPDRPSWRQGGTAVALAFPIEDGSTQAGRNLIDTLRTQVHAVGPDVRLGGSVAQNADFIDAVYGNFPRMIALIGVITFILLARAFRSLLLPLKAVLLNV